MAIRNASPDDTARVAMRKILPCLLESVFNNFLFRVVLQIEVINLNLRRNRKAVPRCGVENPLFCKSKFLLC